MGLHILFNESQLNRWLFALARVDNMVTVAETRDNPRKNAVDFANLLRRNITTQKFANSYAPYNDQYRKWKATYGRGRGTSDYWQLFGDLLAAITVTQVGVGRGKSKGWLGGVPAGVTDQGGKSWFGKGDKGEPKVIAQYGQWGEYGRRGQSPRPVVTPTTDEYKKDGFIDQGEKSLNNVSRQWR